MKLVSRLRELKNSRQLNKGTSFKRVFNQPVVVLFSADSRPWAHWIYPSIFSLLASVCNIL